MCGFIDPSTHRQRRHGDGAFHYCVSTGDIVALSLWLLKWKIAALVASKRNSILADCVK